MLENTIKRCKEKHKIFPTYKQMRNSELIPEKIKDKLANIGLWDLNPLNLCRISWKNEPKSFRGEVGNVNYLELPSELTGVKAKIVVLVEKCLPTGAHKVGATIGPLVEKLVSGTVDSTKQKALCPSTGNYCWDNTYDSYLFACESIAVLPEGMSQERFGWLHKMGAEVFAAPGRESNGKEIYDKVIELKAERGNKIVNLNQFEEIGNSLWHYAVTGPAMEEVYNTIKEKNNHFSGVFLTQGSAGTLGSTDYLREKYPSFKVCAGEALQCPTLLENGYGEHRIEGIEDKLVPWIHSIKNMDMGVDIDDDPNIRIMRLFNEDAGKDFLKNEMKIAPQLVEQSSLMGISSIANMMGCINMAKYYEMDEHDVLYTMDTDSMEMYQSRLIEENTMHGKFDMRLAAVSYEAD